MLAICHSSIGMMKSLRILWRRVGDSSVVERRIGRLRSFLTEDFSSVQGKLTRILNRVCIAIQSH